MTPSPPAAGVGTPRASRPRSSRGTAAALLAALLALAALAGCTLAPPPGEGPLRYRDPVFDAVDVARDVPYGRATSQAGAPVDLKLDLYRPAGDRQTKRPAVVWVHGGGYFTGDKAAGPSAQFARDFAKLGYVTVSINYRLITTPCGGASIPPACFAAAVDAQHDAQAAVRFLRANADRYGIDAARIGIGGESAGGITAASVGMRPDDPGQSGNPGPSSAVGGFVSISGGLPDGVFASAGDAPGLLFHGTADTIVPDGWSVATSAKLLEARVPAFLQLQRGAGHVPFAEYGQQFFEQSKYFLYYMLDLAHADGQSVAAARALDRQLPRLRATYPRFAKRLAQLKRSYPQYVK